ncbi:hypothetical protein OURE66S_04481 [Oligella ureolytica]
MRKDQLWLVEKHDGASELISLVEFDSSQLKNSSPFAKWYYDGRLGGLPSINYSLVNEPPRDCRSMIFLREYDNENTKLYPKPEKE